MNKINKKKQLMNDKRGWHKKCKTLKERLKNGPTIKSIGIRWVNGQRTPQHIDKPNGSLGSCAPRAYSSF